MVFDELAILDRADLLVVQYPMWWHPAACNAERLVPDRVLAYGAAYTSKRRWEGPCRPANARCYQ